MRRKFCIWIFAMVACCTVHAIPGVAAAPTTPTTKPQQKEDNHQLQYFLQAGARDVSFPRASGDGATIVGNYAVAESKEKMEAVHYPMPSSRESQFFGRPVARGLLPSMEMLDSKRRPKPKKPMGNDIGIARGLDPVNGDFSHVLHTTENFDTTISAGPVALGGNSFTSTTESPKEDAETAAISREMHEIMDAIPKMHKLHLPHLELHKDPEEEAINQRITEVARQLAESAMRKEYEEGKLGHIIPLPTTPPQERVHNDGPGKYKKLHSIRNQEMKKSGKALVVSNTLPLVSHFPPATAQLQLITEVQQIPQFMIQEGFHPMTPPPELSGPLLGGPPLKTNEEADSDRTGRAESKSIPLTDRKSEDGIMDIRIPAFLRFPSREYMVIDIPGRGSGFFQVLTSMGGRLKNTISSNSEEQPT